MQKNKKNYFGSIVLKYLYILTCHILLFILFIALEATSNYFDSIPPVPELGANRKFDAGRLREIRKKLDNATEGTKEVEAIAYDCLDEIAELSSGKLF